ncbi:MAG TPA: hypothetical protein ENK89_04590 [Desulfobulbaceae bacterium]|nr:hypothetical protein [Desulfobulbaceae bacterium]
MRIPLIPASDSTGNRPGIPRDSGHRFHSIPAGGSERSDAVNCPLPFSFCSCQVCSFFPHRVSFEF